MPRWFSNDVDDGITELFAVFFHYRMQFSINIKHMKEKVLPIIMINLRNDFVIQQDNVSVYMHFWRETIYKLFCGQLKVMIWISQRRPGRRNMTSFTMALHLQISQIVCSLYEYHQPKNSEERKKFSFVWVDSTNVM